MPRPIDPDSEQRSSRTGSSGIDGGIFPPLLHRLPLAHARRLIRGTAVFLIVGILATIGFRLFGWPWLDAAYMVVITVFGIGYGEVRPVDTPALRLFTILVIVCGYASAVYVIGALVQMLVDGELNAYWGTRRMESKIETLHQHTIICGYGRMGRMLAKQLTDRGQPLVVLDWDSNATADAIRNGLLTIEGNAYDEEALRLGGIDRAATLATVLGDDATNVFITITARGMNPRLKIFARGENTSTVSKLRRVGADHVILPAAIGADRVAKLIVHPTTEALLQSKDLPMGLLGDFEALGLELEECVIDARSPFCNASVASILPQCGHRLLLLAIRDRERNQVTVHPANDTILHEHDRLIMLGRADDVFRFCQQFHLQGGRDSFTAKSLRLEAPP
jgi:voltage-gated potassium channel